MKTWYWRTVVETTEHPPGNYVIVPWRAFRIYLLVIDEYISEKKLLGALTLDQRPTCFPGKVLVILSKQGGI